MKTHESIATSFVNLVLKYNWYDFGKKGEELPENEVQILFNLVSAVGFEPTKMVYGELVIHSEESGDCSINTFCPYKVIIQNDRESFNATGWLNKALCLVMRETDRQKSIEKILHGIACSIPLKQIQLTADGDFLLEAPPYYDRITFFVTHIHDNSKLKLRSCVGVHKYCSGKMCSAQVTETSNAIACDNCNFRIVFPNNIDTFGKLRQYLASKFVQATT